MKKFFTTQNMVRAAIIGSLYTALTLIVMFTPLGLFAFGPIQIRISEVLAVLPFFTPAAVPGLFIGCLITNILGASAGLGGGMLDIIFGSLATLLAAYLTYKIKNKWLAPLPPVIINGIVIGVILHFAVNAPLLETILFVSIGQFVACYLLGMPLILLLQKHKVKLFR